ncbi:MAG: autotransporter outer membrane beta-barrel domain-containing protein [Magnetococcales bacterium]|nr:autotransporter outer membrane beta-barrel domain-containing protein [Magnetococcales bacterium]
MKQLSRGAIRLFLSIGLVAVAGQEAGAFVSNDGCTYLHAKINCSSVEGSFVMAPKALKLGASRTADSVGGHAAGAANQGFSKLRGHSPDSDIIHGFATGEAGGVGVGLWGNGSFTDAETDFTTLRSQTDLINGSIGIDFLLDNRFVLGIAATYEDSETATTFNSGQNDTTGYMVSPYAAVAVDEFVTLDLSFGYGLFDADQRRRSGGSTITSSYDMERTFAAVNLNTYGNIDNWSFSGLFGLLYARDALDDYVESAGRNVSRETVELLQSSVGVEVSYPFQVVEPYISGIWEYDLNHEERRTGGGNGVALPYDDNAFNVGGGLRFTFNETVSAELGGYAILERDDEEEYSASGNLRFDF